jgi:4-aminobutyrate aminotransferase-like enzyme
VSGLFAKHEVLSAFSDQIPYFNTFGGNPVSMAAAQAVLDVIQEEELQQHSEEVGAVLKKELTYLMNKHECIGDVRGAGLFIGFELVTDRNSKKPNKKLALNVIEELRNQHHILTSVAGPHGNVLKLRPPLAFQYSDIDWLVNALDQTLSNVRMFD